VLVQIAALLALSGAAVLYLDWSSNAAQAEFMRAIQSASAPSHLSQPSMPIHRVKSPMTCARKV
jgi:hypothetical protein